MENNKQYDVIVVGAGMGGLTTAAFLAREGKKVLVLEKHDKPGGYVTSFKRKEFTFDSSVYHAPNLSDKEFIINFIKYWGENLQSEQIHYRIKHFLGDKVFTLDTDHLLEQLFAYFPDDKASIEEFFGIAENIMNERFAIGPPSPPYEMSLLGKLRFGMRALKLMPTNMKYMNRAAVESIKEIFPNRTLASVIFGVDPVRIFLLSPLFTWWSLRHHEFYYPLGGMQALPDTSVDALKKNHGEILLRSEVSRILVKDGKAIGVELKDGSQYFAGIVISNSPVHHTLNKLTADVPQLDPMRKKIKHWDVHISAMMNFVGVDQSYDFQGYQWLVFTDESTLDIESKDLTPHNCPIHLIVLPKPEGQKGHSILIPAYLPYEYNNCWGTGGSKVRGDEYNRIKEEAKEIIINRVCEKMGPEFRQAIQYVLPSTPLTYERYTYHEKGNCLGWMMDKNYSSHQLPPETSVKNLYLVGQYGFPGGGVPSVVLNGYLLAKKLLKQEGINLEERMNASNNDQSAFING